MFLSVKNINPMIIIMTTKSKRIMKNIRNAVSTLKEANVFRICDRKNLVAGSPKTNFISKRLSSSFVMLYPIVIINVT